ncbi:hypothetical protein GCM10010421_09960 [Streptomyces glaucus]|uniref:Uncharacterized protein n=1 Tax=Streptomyces glaucus TaxID=284029 RepID=A0ABN3JAW2_9ACTN
MTDDLADTTWDRELDDLFLRIGHRGPGPPARRGRAEKGDLQRSRAVASPWSRTTTGSAARVAG